jgi:hypothetical protein
VGAYLLVEVPPLVLDTFHGGLHGRKAW